MKFNGAVWGLMWVCSGCEKVEQRFLDEFPSAGVRRVQAEMQRGDFSYSGTTPATALKVAGASGGRAASESKAEQRESGNTWDFVVEDELLILRTQSPERRAYVDLAVRGPEQMGLDLQLDDGNVDVEDVEGEHVIFANQVSSRRLRGDVAAESVNGMNLDIWPYADGVISISAVSGSVRLALPYGGPYDIQVWGSPGYAMYVSDLGFTRQFSSDGYFSAQSGLATVRVEVSVPSGEFTLDASY